MARQISAEIAPWGSRTTTNAPPIGTEVDRGKCVIQLRGNLRSVPCVDFLKDTPEGRLDKVYSNTGFLDIFEVDPAKLHRKSGAIQQCWRKTCSESRASYQYFICTKRSWFPIKYHGKQRIDDSVSQRVATQVCVHHTINSLVHKALIFSADVPAQRPDRWPIRPSKLKYQKTFGPAVEPPSAPYGCMKRARSLAIKLNKTSGMS